MARAGKPGAKPPVALAHHAVDPIRRLKAAKLRQALGLALDPTDLGVVARFPRMPSFTREEVIDLLGDGGKGIPRMLPVDVALGRLGMPIVRVLPDGRARRLKAEFPKAWAARGRADRAIALHVAKTYREVPKGWYPDRDRLMMADRVDDAARAAGVFDIGPGARVLLEDAVPFLRFELIPPELRLAGYQMWHRRRLAGIAPMEGDGLVFGFWDDVLSDYDVAAHSFRGPEIALLAVFAMLLRDCAVACFCDADPRAPGRVAYYEGPYRVFYASIATKLGNASRIGPGEPARSYGGGLARLYRLEAARPGAAWSARPVRDRPECGFDMESFSLVNATPPADVDPALLPEGYVPGAVVPWTEWAERFVSA